jgi:hypothetical protein
MTELWDFCMINDSKKVVYIANNKPLPLDVLTVFRSKFEQHGRRFMNTPAGQLGSEFADYLVVWSSIGGTSLDYYNENRMMKND